MATARKARPIEPLSYDPELGPDYFVQIPQTILKDTDLTNGAFRLYCILLSYCRRPGKNETWPGQDTLSTDLGTSVKQIQRLLQELKEIGLVDWRQNGQSSNRYHVFKAPLKQRYSEAKSSDATKMSLLDATKMSPLDATKMSHESHEVEQQKLEQHHGDDELKTLLMQEGFATSTSEKLTRILAKNERTPTYIQDWLKYVKSDPGITRPLGFLRSMIEENQNPPQTQTQREAAATAQKMAKWQKLASKQRSNLHEAD
jgi:predicted transcriptional regulator